jgi:hypothetical protein
VYQKTKNTKNSIDLSFAKGLLVERKGIKINWAKFAEHVGTIKT